MLADDEWVPALEPAPLRVGRPQGRHLQFSCHSLPGLLIVKPMALGSFVSW